MFRKKIVDERQQMEMYKIEHYGFWFMFWALFASICLQEFILDVPFIQVAGEWIIFMIAALGSAIAFYRGGFWDYTTKPCVKTYLIYSVIFTIVFDVITLVGVYRNHNYYNITGFIIMGIFMTVMFFVLCFVLLFIMGEATKKRVKKLEQQTEDNDN